MPIPARSHLQKRQEIPATLRPFLFHGLDFDLTGSDDVYAECPFCGRDGKLGIEVATSQWHCNVCEAKGNATSFLRQLWKLADEQTKDYDELAANRKLLFPETLMHWGCAISPLTRDWIIPAFGAAAKLDQLYRYAKDFKSGKRRCMATSGMGHQMFGVHLFDRKKPMVYVCEGPWDGMALWEVLRLAERDDTTAKIVPAVTEASSMSMFANVIAVPGAGFFPDAWAPLFGGKDVVLMYDNDHPRELGGKTIQGAGISGMQKAAALLASSRHKPKSIAYLRWGENGYDEVLPTNYDIRDWLTEGDTAAQRVAFLSQIMSKIKPIPENWAPHRTTTAKQTGETEVELIPCDNWAKLIEAWVDALRWRQTLENMLAIGLAVVLSTDQKGDQLFFQFIGDPGTGKTTICEAMLTNEQYCYPLEHLTGFHSGWRDPSGDGKDFSVLTRCNHKCMITPEGNVLASNPRFGELMDQQRRIFDGTSGASYKWFDEDRRYVDLRTPWIIAATPSFIQHHQAHLGDRFLRFWVESPEQTEGKSIIMQVAHTGRRAVRQSSNGAPGNTIREASKSKAYQMTGGYIQYLRDNVNELLTAIEIDEEPWVEERCAALGEFVADMRARPDTTASRFAPDKEPHTTKELPTRLTHQFVRLADCLAVVLNKKKVDEAVMKLLTQVAKDSVRGRTLDIVLQMHKEPEGSNVNSLSIVLGELEDRVKSLILFLRKIGVVEYREVPQKKSRRKKIIKSKPQKRWFLSKRFAELLKGVFPA